MMTISSYRNMQKLFQSVSREALASCKTEDLFQNRLYHAQNLMECSPWYLQKLFVLKNSERPDQSFSTLLPKTLIKSQTSYYEASAWNSLPGYVQQINDRTEFKPIHFV